jgi:hypothetical protein
MSDLVAIADVPRSGMRPLIVNAISAYNESLVILTVVFLFPRQPGRSQA